MSFLLLKSVHLIALVCWFAALFYLPRLFVYHAQVATDGTDDIGNERFKVMEFKLLRVIAYPAAVVTLVSGLSLLSLDPDRYLGQSWFLLKMMVSTLLFVFHGFCHYYQRLFASDSNIRSQGFYRVFNELPTLALIAIIVLAVVKP